ncbi:peptide ABC transporter substrate-binding protein [Candidatus Halobeggiatoa sp. HSG11]|nr:peptide ABC transporter substrate-binding protein [Candidatus Halobeggiatoa sp. HSG11]
MSMLFKLVSTILIVIITNGCEPQNQKVKPQTTQQQVGYLRLPLKNAVNTVDPGLVHSERDIELVEQLFLGLTDFDPQTNEVVAELAQDWQIYDDGTLYIFYLRQDVKWLNGDQVTANDIVWTIRRNIIPKTDAPYAHMLNILKNAAAINQGKITDTRQLGVRAIDDYTLEFKLEHAASYFPALVSLPIYRPLPRKTVKKYGKDWTKPENIQTNGSFMLAEWDKGKRINLKKNTEYYQADKVDIPQIQYTIVHKDSLALAMYEKNELDVVGGQIYLQIPPRKISKIKSDPNLRKDIHSSPYLCTYWYGFNTKRPPMDNLLVRKAIAAAIDKRTLLNATNKSEHILTTTFTRPPVFGAVDSNEDMGILFNPKQAKAWLAEAGYPNGKDFPEVTLMYNSTKENQATVTAVKTILKHYLNIDIEIREFDFASYIATLQQSDKPHIFRMSWCANDYPDAHNWLYEVFHPQKGINWIGWDNLEFANAVERAAQISDPEERKQLYHHAEQILTETEVVIVPLYFLNTQYLVKPWIKNWYPMAFGGQHIRNWTLR